MQGQACEQGRPPKEIRSELNEKGRAVIQNGAPAMRGWEMWGRSWDIEKRERRPGSGQNLTKALKREERKG